MGGVGVGGGPDFLLNKTESAFGPGTDVMIKYFRPKKILSKKLLVFINIRSYKTPILSPKIGKNRSKV
jgi:hypothetical protein